MNDENNNLLPDIGRYLELNDFGFPISIKELDWIVDKLLKKFPKEIAKIIVRTFFQEIRHGLLRGEKVCLRDFGEIIIASPKTTNSKVKVFLRFRPYPKFKKRLNDND